MIEIYSRVLGVNFPWAKYDQSVIPDFTYGGMENVSATTQTDLALHGAGGEPEIIGQGTRRTRARAPVVRRSHDHGNVGARVAQRGTHHVHGIGARGEKSRLGCGAAQLDRTAAGGDGCRSESGASARLRRRARQRSHSALLLRTRLSQRRAARAPASTPARRLRVLGRDAPLSHRQRVQAGARPPITRSPWRRSSGRDLDWFFDQWAYGIGYPKVQVTRAWNAPAKTLTLTFDRRRRSTRRIRSSAFPRRFASSLAIPSCDTRSW